MQIATAAIGAVRIPRSSITADRPRCNMRHASRHSSRKVYEDDLILHSYQARLGELLNLHLYHP